MHTRHTSSVLIAVVVSALVLARGAGLRCRQRATWNRSPSKGV
jgi:hypothetical protein